MIIRLTVHDNDFSDLLGLFMKSLYRRLTAYPTGFDKMDTDEKIQCIQKLEEFGNLLNPNISEEHTDDEKEVIVNRVKESFAEFVNLNDKESAEYLIGSLDVSVIKSFEDGWENGEAWYWFQHSGICLNQ